MNKPLAFMLVVLFAAAGALVYWATRRDKNPIVRFYPYLIWNLDLCLLILTIIINE